MGKMGLHQEIRRCHRHTDRSDRKDLVTSWEEEELYEGTPESAFSLIFRTQGCSWSHSSGCSMCGYYTDTNPDINLEDLERQLEQALSEYDGQSVVKIYTSGSYFDPDEFSEQLAKETLSSFDSEGAGKVVVETRPEFVTPSRTKDYSSEVNTLEVALGLESADDFILKNCINKGFRYSDYAEARETIFNKDTHLRTYLLFKPPFLTEKEAIADMQDSIETVDHPKNIISINPMNVQRGTLVEKLWKRGSYRPPWLYSIAQAITSSDPSTTLVTSSVGLGSDRGAHNCRNCDENIIDALEEYDLTQNISTLLSTTQSIDCSCREKWEKQKELEPYMHFRGSIDLLIDRYAGYV